MWLLESAMELLFHAVIITKPIFDLTEPKIAYAITALTCVCGYS